MILFLIQPYPSHYYPTFGLAHQLAKDGNTLVYTATEDSKELIEREGFQAVVFNYLGEDLIKNWRVFIGVLLRSLLAPNAYAERQMQFTAAYCETKQVLENYDVSRVYIDQSLAEYYFFTKPYLEDIVILHTKLYSGRVPGIPPFNSTQIPTGSKWSDFRAFWSWRGELFKLRWRELLKRLAFLGKDEIFLWKKHCVDVDLVWKDHIDLQHALNRGIKGVRQYILATSELEFDLFRLPGNVSFFESIPTKNEEHYFSKRYLNLLSTLRKEQSYRLIYMSFGSFVGHGNQKVTAFYSAIINLVSSIPDTILCVSTGHSVLQLKPNHNTYIFSYVPQQHLLGFTDLFITHGGLGSVKEGLYHKVPMLVVPLNKYIDQPGNAARIKAKGFGDFLNIDRYTEKEIRQKLLALLPEGISAQPLAS